MQNDSREAPRNGLDDYIQVSSPSLRIVIGALILVLVATIAWGFFGRIPVTLTVTGCVVSSDLVTSPIAGDDTTDGAEGRGALVICFIDSAQYSAEQLEDIRTDVSIAMPDHTTFKGRIESISPVPLSRDEAKIFLEDSEWVVEECVSSDYSWAIVVLVYEDVSKHMFTTPQVTFTTDEVPPISFLTR